MDRSFDGKHIEWFCFNEGVAVRPAADETLVLSNSYHGDHEEIWIVHKKDGKEIARYNARYVAIIHWK